MSKKLRVKSLKTLAILHFVTKLKLLHIIPNKVRKCS